MNKELLIQVRDHILAEPRRLNMTSWKMQVKPGNSIPATYEKGQATGSPTYYRRLDRRTAPPCGTMGCIAGWTLLITNTDENYNSVHRIAAELLDLDYTDAGTLFYPDKWEGDHFKAYAKAKGPSGRAKVVAKVINQFIAAHE